MAEQERLTLPDQEYYCAAASAFGLEGAISGELKRLGMHQIKPEIGFVRFLGTVYDVFRCNLRLRFSDRVYLILAEASCKSFEELYQLVISVPWEHFVNGEEAFNLTAQCARSRLMSPRDCQSVSKKALLERLKAKTRQKSFAEEGSPFPVHIVIHTDTVRILLDTSGTSLSRRGYRTWNGEAPLRETLAASLVEYSPWRPGMQLYDPCCGTGTLLIEAALRQGHIAPGLNRSFSMESFSFVSKDVCADIRNQYKEECNYNKIHGISGSDSDPEAIKLAKRHIAQAHMEGKILTQILPLQNVQLNAEQGVFLCNPPYGERMSDKDYCRNLYHELFLLQKRHPGWSLSAISSDPGFEKAYGRHADKVRRLYNGRLECQFYTYLPLNHQ